MTSKKDLSERDICTQFIVPALQKAGWDIARQEREEVFFTDGRIFVKGNKTARGERKRADFILYYKPNIPVAEPALRGGLPHVAEFKTSFRGAASPPAPKTGAPKPKPPC